GGRKGSRVAPGGEAWAEERPLRAEERVTRRRLERPLLLPVSHDDQLPVRGPIGVLDLLGPLAGRSSDGRQAGQGSDLRVPRRPGVPEKRCQLSGPGDGFELRFTQTYRQQP